VRLATLFRNEMLKMFKRLSFWVTFGLFSFIVVVQFGERLYGARKDSAEPFALPAAWQDVFGEGVIIAIIFGCVLLVLLIANEFSWRTARQNVIDGLSKEQWFAGKMMLMPILALLLLGEFFLVGGGVAFLGTDLSAASGPLMTGAQWAAIGGHFLAFLGVGSLAFATAIAIRSTGAAMAVWFFYIGFGEQLLGMIMGRLGEWLRPAVGFLPFRVFTSLTEYLQYDPAAYRRAVETAAASDAPLPEIPATGDMVLAALLWMAALILLSFLWFRKRDL